MAFHEGIEASGPPSVEEEGQDILLSLPGPDLVPPRCGPAVSPGATKTNNSSTCRSIRHPFLEALSIRPGLMVWWGQTHSHPPCCIFI